MCLKPNKVDDVPRCVSVKSLQKHNLNITPDQLKSMMQTRGKETIEKIYCEYGGVEGLCSKLDVTPSEGSSFFYSHPISKVK